jgi:hypothetical protein
MWSVAGWRAAWSPRRFPNVAHRRSRRQKPELTNGPQKTIKTIVTSLSAHVGRHHPDKIATEGASSHARSYRRSRGPSQQRSILRSRKSMSGPFSAQHARGEAGARRDGDGRTSVNGSTPLAATPHTSPAAAPESFPFPGRKRKFFARRGCRGSTKLSSTASYWHRCAVRVRLGCVVQRRRSG